MQYRCQSANASTYNFLAHSVHMVEKKIIFLERHEVVMPDLTHSVIHYIICTARTDVTTLCLKKTSPTF